MSLFKKWSFSLVCVLSLSIAGVVIADEMLKDAKCPVSGEAVNKEKHASWKDGNVYFCCENCQAAFEKDSESHAPKANLQLVATHQYKQEACPFTGGPTKDGTEVEVSGVKVSFCCNNCQGKAKGKEGDDQISAIFGEEPFKKGKFVKIEEKKE
jgi:YHS domain-containing protein